MYNSEPLDGNSSSYVTIELPPRYCILYLYFRKASTMVSTTQAYKKGPRLTHTNSMVIKRMRALPYYLHSLFKQIESSVKHQWFHISMK